MLPSTYTRYIFSERPTGEITSTTFKQETRSIEDFNVTDAEKVVVKVTWLSLDPAMRGWLNDSKRSYIAPVKLGEVMRALGLGIVVRVGAGSKFAVGDLVSGAFGWTEYSLINSSDVTKLTLSPGAKDIDYLGVLGTSGGLTAYFGLLNVGKIKQGETLIVSGAAGSVGSVVCQIGKLKGARVIAIAGGTDKCNWLRNEIGVDLALDYKNPQFYDKFSRLDLLADVYFDNVGGEILNFMMTRMNLKGRIVLCGAISDYNGKPTGLTSYMSLISQRARIEGFVIFDYKDQYHKAIADLSEWLASGSIKRKFHIVEGLDKAPVALPMLFKGGNTGKLLVRVSNGGRSAKL